MKKCTISIFVALLAWVQSAGADVTVFTNKAQWQNVVGSHTTLPFTNLPAWTVVTNQYEAQGVICTDGNDLIHYSGSYPNDGRGLTSFSDGVFGRIRAIFPSPRYALAVDYIGTVRLDLYSGNQVIHSTTDSFSDVVSNFAGLVSTTPFDAAIVWRYTNHVVAIDDLHFGPPIAPAMGACCLDNGTCQKTMIQVECLYRGGLYQGDDSVCARVDCPTPCPADTDDNGTVNIEDLLAVISGWGGCPFSPTPCPPDVNHNHIVNIDDLLAVITTWGPCPP